MNIYNIKMSEYGIINFLEEYIEALKKPIRFKYTNADKIEMLKQTIELINEQHDKIEELRNPTICGRTIEEVVNILNGLDLEKETDLEVTMENLKSFMAIYQKEVEDSLHNATTELISSISGTGARIEFQIPHYDFLKKEKGE